MTGLVGGLLAAGCLSFPMSLLPKPFGQVLPMVAAVVCAWLGISVFVMRQRDIFSLFRSRLTNRLAAEGAGTANEGRSVLIDTSVIIDGRIADISHTGFIDMDVPGVREVDDKLVILAKQLNAAVITNDYNLNHVAQLQGVSVLNINELANAVKAVFLHGEGLTVKIIQEGREAGQGVGYLDDGTMVVVDDGRAHISQEVPVVVTKVLQTTAGRMIFAKLENGNSR